MSENWHIKLFSSNLQVFQEYYFPQSSNREERYLNFLLTCECRSLLLTIRQKIASWFNVMPLGI